MLSGRNRQQNFLQEDFWPGTTFVLSVTHTEPAIAAAPSVNASRLKVTNLDGLAPATVLAGSWVELGTEGESLLQVLGENAYFGG
jgi:hypothetical protein